MPLMKAMLRPPTAPLVAVTEFPLDLSVQYLAGGGAPGLPVVAARPGASQARAAARGLRGLHVRQRRARGRHRAPRRGRRRGAGRGRPGEGAADAGRERPGGAPRIHQREALVARRRGHGARHHHGPAARRPRRGTCSPSWSSAIRTARRRPCRRGVPLWPAAWLVGHQARGLGGLARATSRRQVAVVDVRGAPVAGAPVEVDVFARTFYSYRKRLVGGFYAYEHVEEIAPLGAALPGRHRRQAACVDCEGAPPASGGSCCRRARCDAAGRRIAAHQEVWVAGDDEWWFEVRDSDRIDLAARAAALRARRHGAPAGAHAVPRGDGAGHRRARGRARGARRARSRGKEPVIEVPVEAAHAPNVFVSVLVVRGRVSGVAAHRARRPRAARLQARHCRDPGGLARASS